MLYVQILLGLSTLTNLIGLFNDRQDYKVYFFGFIIYGIAFLIVL